MRPIWLLRLQSLAFTIIFTIAIILVMLVLVIGPVIWSYVQPHLDVPWEWGWSYEALRYLIAVGLLYVVVALLYRWLPSRHLPRREVLPGAAVTVVLWVALASLFSLYLRNLADLWQSWRHRDHPDVFLCQRADLHFRRRDQQRPAARRGCAPARGARGRTGGARWLIRATTATMRRVRDPSAGVCPCAQPCP